MTLCINDKAKTWFWFQIITFWTPSDGTLLGRTSEEVFVVSSFCCWCSSFHFWSSFYCCCSFHFQAALPCQRHSTLASQTHEGLHQLWALPRLLLIAFAFSSTVSATVLSRRFLPTGVFYLTLLCFFIYRERYGFEWAFFTHRRFTLCSFTCVYQGFPGSRQFFLEICRTWYWSSKHRPSPSVCLIHSNLQKIYTGRFYLRVRAA